MDKEELDIVHNTSVEDNVLNTKETLSKIRIQLQEHQKYDEKNIKEIQDSINRILNINIKQSRLMNYGLIICQATMVVVIIIQILSIIKD